MDKQEVKWEQYPLVATHSAAQSFVERLVLKGKRPKTVDAYARAIEDLLAYITETDPERLFEADEADLDGYIAHLKQRGPKKRGQESIIADGANNSLPHRLQALRQYHRSTYRGLPSLLRFSHNSCMKGPIRSLSPRRFR